MKATAPETIDQALFGYADGHRQIASSLRLPPKDLYLLSTASDLASGARLSDDESYLSGLPLPESRCYALFRTWAAPEMPRPGCVWSHVILLGPKTTASLAAFSTLLPLFRRPHHKNTSGYGEPISQTMLGSSTSAPLAPIADIIEAYYGGRRVHLSPLGLGASDVEDAVLAVWSQQWPRLRSTYSFCTALAKEDRRADASDYDVQVTLHAVPHESAQDRAAWVTFAATDAAANRVTPLRRFLWRYGRDASNSRRNYSMLVELFERWGNAEAMPIDAASAIFEALSDPADGAILKRDVMGLGAAKPRLIPSISAVDFLHLMTSEALPEAPTAAEVELRLADLGPKEAGVVARYYDHNREALSPWKETIYRAIIECIDKPNIMADFPEDILADALMAREDLVDADTLAKISNEALLGLTREPQSHFTRRYIYPEIFRREMGETGRAIIAEAPDATFRYAVEAYIDGRLDRSWLRSFPSYSEGILQGAWLDSIESTTELAAIFAILNYPRNLSKFCDEFSRRIDKISDDATGPDRLNMQAALLRVAIDESSQQSWNLIIWVLPQLRPFIVNNELPETAHAMLKTDLPSFYSAGYWDLDKRVLLSLSKLYQNHPNEQAVQKLGLSKGEAQVVIEGEKQTIPNPFTSFLRWF